MIVTKDYFHVIGLRPVAGRSFENSDFGQGPVKTILLGYEFWQRAFGGDKQIIGKTVRISRRQVSPIVIGVMEPGVRFLPSPGAAKEPNYDVNATVDFWAPAEPDPKYLKAPNWNVVARLRDGVTPPQAQQELAVLAANEAQAEKQFEGFVPQVEPVTDEMNRDGRRLLLPLLGASALVLLIACGNARTAARARTAETAGIRGALRHGIEPQGPSKASFDGKPAVGDARRGIWHRAGIWRRKAVQGDRGTCHSAA
jgi:putative ABC transport system permease protein